MVDFNVFYEGIEGKSGKILASIKKFAKE